MPIKIISRVEQAHQLYFDLEVAHLMQLPFVEFVRDTGETDDQMRNEFLGGADALLSPADQSDPFALPFIEAFACGTPVVAFRSGSVGEIVTEGLNGFIVDSVASAITRIGQLDRLSRSQCRKVFESRFTVARTARSYLELLIENLRLIVVAPIGF